MRGALFLLLVGTLLSAASQAQNSTEEGVPTQSDQASRLRKEIDKLKQNLATLEDQLAAEENKQGEEAAAREDKKQEQLAAQEKETGRTKDNAQKESASADAGEAGLNTNNRQRSSERTFALNLLSDQKAFWTSPLRIRLDDANWLVPFAAATTALIGSDTSIEKELPTSPTLIQHSRSFSNYSLASLAGVAGGMYLWGSFTQNEHARETGFLGGEAVADSLLSSEAIKFVTGRDRPFEGNGKGDFGQGGSSFPSEQAAAAWSLASIIAHEYPGPLTQLLAYGAASGISAARVLGREHFTADVFVGSALGWYMGRQVYRAHHNPELDGAEWGTFERSHEAPKPENMGSPYVPLDTWVYPAFDRLAALDYVQTAFADLRPWTRLECARLVQEAGGLLQQEDVQGGEAVRLYRALADEFSREVGLLEGGRNLGTQVESIYTRFTGISGPPLTDGYHFGQTIVNNYGRPYQEGFNMVTGASGWAEAGPFTFYVRGEYQHSPWAPALSEGAQQYISSVDFPQGELHPALPATPFLAVNNFQLLDTYVAVNLKNWQVSFGKQSLWWGPSLGGPLLFSDNAEPVNMLRISRTSPFKLPSILGRLLGPIRSEWFLGQLAGHEFVFQTNTGLVGQFGLALGRQPFIQGQKISLKPTPNFEFSVSTTTMFAGGPTPLTWHTFFRSYSISHTAVPGASDAPGDRRSSVDATYRIPGMRKWLTFYGDALTEDEFSPLGYPRKSAYQGGIYMPRIPGVPKLDLRLEGGSTVPADFPDCTGCFYINGRYPNGYTNAGNLLGSWLGRGSQGEQAWGTYWLTSRDKIQLNYRHQKVDKLVMTGGATLSDAGVKADFWLGSTLSVSGAVQYEKWNYPVLDPLPRSNVTTSIQLSFWPRDWSLPAHR